MIFSCRRKNVDDSTWTKKLLQTAGELILNDIKAIPSERDCYRDFSSDCVDTQLCSTVPEDSTEGHHSEQRQCSDLRVASPQDPARKTMSSFGTQKQPKNALAGVCVKTSSSHMHFVVVTLPLGHMAYQSPLL